MPGIGLVTNYHVTECGEFFSIFNVDTYDEKSLGIVGKTLNEISSDNAIDYAVYKLPFTINEELTFKCGDSRKSKVGDQVTIIGYPNHQKGKKGTPLTYILVASPVKSISKEHRSSL